MNACQFFLLRYTPVHASMIKDIVYKASGEELRRCPIPGVNSIAWLLWHMARAEDIAINRFVAHRPQLFFEEGWADRLNVPDSDFGVGMTAGEVSDLSARLNLEEVKTYWAAVEQRTRSIVQQLSPENLDEANDPDYIRHVVREDGMFREAGMWGEGLWAEMQDRSKGYFLAYLVLTHNWLHFSEASVTLSLLGMPGR
jgi:DinB superfamily